MNLNDLFTEEKVRLDPKCWTGKKIGNPKTKVKGGVRVNNCVPAESVAEGSLNEFAPGAGGGESGRWYTDDQITDLVGDGWWNDLDVSGASIGVPDGNVPKEYMIQEAQAWLDDQGYSVQVLNCRVNDDDMEWYIEGNFHNPGFAKQGMAEGNMPLTRAVDAKGRTQQQWMQAVKSKFPDAQIIQAKMMDGPCVANLSDGRRLNWIKAEQGVAEDELDEDWKKTLAGIGMAGAMALGAGGAHARVSGDQDPGVNRLTGKPNITQQSTDVAPVKAQAPGGFSKEYLQSVVDGTHPRPMISVEKAQSLLNNMQEGVAEGYDSEELANEVYAEFERIYPNLARRAHERTIHAAIMDVLNYGGDNNPGALAQDVARAVKQQMQQGVAEGSLSEVDREQQGITEAEKIQMKINQIIQENYSDLDVPDVDYRDEIASLENQIKHAADPYVRSALHKQLANLKAKYRVDDELDEGWKEDYQAHKEFLDHAKQELQAATPSERLSLATRLSNLEKQHFGDKVGQGFNDVTGTHGTTANGLSAGINSILQDVINAKPSNVQNLPFGRVSNHDVWNHVANDPDQQGLRPAYAMSPEHDPEEDRRREELRQQQNAAAFAPDEMDEFYDSLPQRVKVLKKVAKDPASAARFEQEFNDQSGMDWHINDIIGYYEYMIKNGPMDPEGYEDARMTAAGLEESMALVEKITAVSGPAPAGYNNTPTTTSSKKPVGPGVTGGIVYTGSPAQRPANPANALDRVRAGIGKGVAEGSLNEFAPASNPGGGNYLKALASAWYNGTFNTGNLHKGIKSQEDVERILERGIHCGDGKIRKYSIGYNANFDGVEIQSDDHYEYADYDDAGRDIDSRTGKPWGPYDVVEFHDRELDESVAEGNKKPEQPEADYGDDYQDMVARMKKLAGLGPLKTQYDPAKRVYRNVPTAVQPKK
jgi:hypothetical protein